MSETRFASAHIANSTRHRASLAVQHILIGTVVVIAILAATMSVSAQTGVYTLNGGTASQTGQTYAATSTDQSSVYVLNSGHLTLTNCTLTKTGDASNVNTSSQYGTNAGVLAKSAGTVIIVGGSVTANASGGNGLFATGSGSSITMSDGTIYAAGGGAHGVDATYTGTIILKNVDIITTGSNSSALATDFGGGTVIDTGGTIVAQATESGSHSAGIYSTGTISVVNASVASLGDCGGVIDGANSILLTNTTLSGVVEGIKTWKTAPASGAAVVTIDGGSLTCSSGDGFYVTGETGNAALATITVKNGATVTAGTGNIINVIKSSTATFTADTDTLSGNLVADSSSTSVSTLSIILKNNTVLTGTITHASVNIDATSKWQVNANSTITSLTDASGVSGTSITNIVGNGFLVRYDSTLSANSWLGAKTYSLVSGGYLLPQGVEAPAAVVPIVINEFMADNAATVADQDGEYEDWIELYNPNATSVTLKKVHLSDKLTKPGKWTLPDTAIAAYGYLTVWADEDTLQVGLHANFALSKSGEAVVLSDSSLTILDSITFGAQTTDTSYGRCPNGTGIFGSMLPTFSTANDCGSSCCEGTTGNVNVTGIVDLSDLSALVSYLTGGGYVLQCDDAANVNATGIVDLSDLSALVSYLTGGGYVLPNCP